MAQISNFVCDEHYLEVNAHVIFLIFGFSEYKITFFVNAISQDL